MTGLAISRKMDKKQAVSKGERGMMGVFMVVIVLLGGILYLLLSPKVPAISPDELMQIMENNQNILIIDVREKREYESGHIPGSIHVPLRQLERIKKKVDQQENDGGVYLYCRSGSRSAIAVRELRKLGCRNVYLLRDGLMNWNGPVQKAEEKTDE
jgi:phage shock protein E